MTCPRGLAYGGAEWCGCPSCIAVLLERVARPHPMREFGLNFKALIPMRKTEAETVMLKIGEEPEEMPGHVQIRNRSGATLSFPVSGAALPGMMVPREIGEGWTYAYLDGPLPAGRLLLQGPVGEQKADLVNALAEGERHRVVLRPDLRNAGLVRASYERARAVSSRGELLFGQPGAVPGFESKVLFVSPSGECVEDGVIMGDEPAYKFVRKKRRSEMETRSMEKAEKLPPGIAKGKTAFVVGMGTANQRVMEEPEIRARIAGGCRDTLLRLSAFLAGVAHEGTYGDTGETEAELRERLWRGFFRDEAPPWGRKVATPEAMRGRTLFPAGDALPARKQASHMLSITCPSCRKHHVHPLGEQDPREGRCAHEFDLDARRGRMGAFVCRGCGLEVRAEALLDAGLESGKRYCAGGNSLADEAQRLRDENRAVLAENAALRRRVEKLERKPR